MELLENEPGASGRRYLRQFGNFIAAFPVDAGHQFECSRRLRKILLSLAIDFVNLFPRRSKKDEWSVPVTLASAPYGILFTQINQSRIAERIGYSAIAEHRPWRRRVFEERLDGSF